MTRKAGLIALAIIAALCLFFPLIAFAQQRSKPTLFIVHADWCPPCRVFDTTFTRNEDFQTALRRAAELRELDWEKPDERAYAINHLRVDQIPAYVLVRDGRIVSKHFGFTSSLGAAAVDEAIRDLMDSLDIEWPPARSEAKPAPRPDPRPEPKPARTAEPLVDREARDGITKLATQSKQLAATQEQTAQRVEAIAADVQKIRSEVTESTNGLRSQIESGSRESRTQLETISKTLQKSIESTRSSTREELQTIIRERIEAAGSPSQIPGTGDISTEISSDKSSPGPTASKWLRVLAWAGKTGLAIAAPEVAIPGSIGLTVAGLGLRWLMRRRQPKPLGTVENPIRVADNGDVRTETKFVVSETDVLGESFKEAIRRVGNTHRESSPHIIDVLKQVDAAATQLAHGKRVVRRPANAPVSESEP
jgi:thioredoxin-like negative regulator of GroEL